MPIQNSRRTRLQNTAFAATAHAGLWHDRFIGGQNHGALERGETNCKQRLFEELPKIAVPEIYAQGHFMRWQETLQTLGAQCKTLQLTGRMIVGLGNESVLETSVALHRVYGVPYIPGSALKGLAASYAHQNLGPDWRTEGAFHKLVFGAQDTAGYITFHDALLIPERPQMPLHQEIMTVHHSDYYGDGSNAPPADWDSPVPIMFLSASGRYLVALSAAPELANVVTQAFTILAWALETEGVGAKTSSGYGRGVFEKSADDLAQEQERQQLEGFFYRLKNLRPQDVAAQINNFVNEWRTLKISPTSKQRIAQAILDKVKEAGRAKASKDKSWYQELMRCVGGAK